MEVQFINKPTGKSKTFYGMAQIPRIGEKVSLFYHPAPTVIEILHMPVEDIILIMTVAY